MMSFLPTKMDSPPATRIHCIASASEETSGEFIKTRCNILLDDSVDNNNLSMDYSNMTDIRLMEPNLWCLALVLFPAACIFGNALVVMAVLSEKSLKTSTNFLLVSLACADLLVGTLVMPFSIYLTINRLQWYLPEFACNFFCVVDVSASTSSIVHLVAISIDRFYAVVLHMEYKTRKHQRRVYGTIIFSWLFSIGIGLPLGIGLNHGRESSNANNEYECGIVNTDYMLYSSIFAFYIPCLVMTIMYSFVFYKLHRRMRAVRLQEMAAGQMVQFGDNLGNILQHAYGNKENLTKASMIWAIPFLKTLEQTIAENDDMSTEELDELTTILQTLESDPQHRAILQQSMMEDIPESPENSHHGGGSGGGASAPPGGTDRLLSPRHQHPYGSGRRHSRLVTILNSMASNRRRRRRRIRRANNRSGGSSGQSSTRSGASGGGGGLASILAAMSNAAGGGGGGHSSKDTNSEDTSSDLGSSGRSRSDSEKRRRQSLYMAKQKIKTLKDRAIELLMKLKSKQGMAIRKETRATKLVSTVMLVFLLCWTPFFTLNIVKVVKLRTNTWTYELESLFIFFTWLGYLNSCLNPVIYSLFNRNFRRTFQKLLRLSKDNSESPMHRRGRLYTRPFAGGATTYCQERIVEEKKTWVALAHRMSFRGSPRKTGTDQQQPDDSPRNGALITVTRSLPPGNLMVGSTPPPRIVGTNLDEQLQESTDQLEEENAACAIRQRKMITWDVESSGRKTSESRTTIIENTVVRSPDETDRILEEDDNVNEEDGDSKKGDQLQQHRQNGLSSEAALLRRVQSLRCQDQLADQNGLDFTEPVEV